MWEVVFNRVSLATPNRYLLLLGSATSAQKRTQICQEWTSSPHFSSLPLQQLSSLTLKLCEATHDKKLRVLGQGHIPEDHFQPDAQTVWQGDVNIEQQVEGTSVCVGLCNVTIARKVEFSEVQSEVDKLKQKEEGEDSLEMSDDAEEGEGEDEDEVRIEVHCGFGFYLGSGFQVGLKWGRAQFETRLVKDKLTPVWSESGTLQGKDDRPLEIYLRDDKQNILESIKFQLSSLRIMFPYHLRIICREEFMGAVPQFFLSLHRLSHPRHSILERPLTFSLRHLGEPLKHNLFLALAPTTPVPRFPTFLALDCAAHPSLHHVNQTLTSRAVSEQDRIELIGLNHAQQEKSFSLLKSWLSRKLTLQVFWAWDLKECFLGEGWSGCRPVESRADFEAVLRKVYYHGDSFTLKKYLEIYNPIQQPENVLPESPAERWKTLSSNYLLRHKLVATATAHVAELKAAIDSKVSLDLQQGQQLVQLKKVVEEVKLVGSSLAIKDKLMTVGKKLRKVRLNAKNIDPNDLTAALIDRQLLLESKKNVNEELALRMGCLAEVEQTQQGLDAELVANSKQLLQQQARLTRMQTMQQGLQKQRQIIGELEKIFERREVDKRVNEALKEQSHKLSSLRQEKQQGLLQVYNMVKQQSSKAASLPARVKMAEQLLVSLNEQYARLTAL